MVSTASLLMKISLKFETKKSSFFKKIYSSWSETNNNNKTNNQLVRSTAVLNKIENKSNMVYTLKRLFFFVICFSIHGKPENFDDFLNNFVKISII